MFPNVWKLAILLSPQISFNDTLLSQEDAMIAFKTKSSVIFTSLIQME